VIGWMPILAKPKSWQANILAYQNQAMPKYWQKNLDTHFV